MHLAPSTQRHRAVEFCGQIRDVGYAVCQNRLSYAPGAGHAGVAGQAPLRAVKAWGAERGLLRDGSAFGSDPEGVQRWVAEAEAPIRQGAQPPACYRFYIMELSIRLHVLLLQRELCAHDMQLCGNILDHQRTLVGTHESMPCRAIMERPSPDNALKFHRTRLLCERHSRQGRVLAYMFCVFHRQEPRGPRGITGPDGIHQPAGGAWQLLSSCLGAAAPQRGHL